MEFTLYSIKRDNVIDAHVALGETTYKEALYYLNPLIDKFDSQRKIQDKKFYEKLKRDMIDGCVIPPITVAFIEPNINADFSVESAKRYFDENIENAFILDGIQRLNTLKNASAEGTLDITGALYFNAIFCSSEDKLLYRMITLNNGQRPMTPRHQVEVMMKSVLKITPQALPVQTEKERGKGIIRGSFNYADLVQAYLAFITNSIHIDNAKIIDEKMDQLLVGKILDNEPRNYSIKFDDVLNLIIKMIDNKDIKTWLKTTNNLLGFCVGINTTYATISTYDNDQIIAFINKFEEAFEGLDKSKIKLGKVRKQLVKFYISGIDRLKNLDVLDLLDVLGQEIE